MNDIQRGLIEIRNASIDELDNVVDVVISAYEEFAEFIPNERWDRYVDNIKDIRTKLEEAEIVVVLQDRIIVASATFYPKHKREIGKSDLVWPNDWTAIRLVAVQPEKRMQGIGRMLMEECINRSRDQSAIAVGLHTTSLMSVAASMYEKMGFVRVPEFDLRTNPNLPALAYKLTI